ncbi:helix-turn-helix domain-containing protein [Brevibacillus borstelensis]|uniref:helix-turn-helix domain-containing protein n=1 Tax=Brevibacillus borstelensis TaxID=45462 RepID=UPI0030BCC6F8
MEPNIGKRMKARRLEKQLTLKQVAEKTELSISFLSQVERSKSSVTLESLTKISEALDVSPSYFFPQEKSPNSYILRKGSGDELHSGQSRFMYKDLSADIPAPLFEPILVTLLPDDEKGTPFAHKGQEFLYVLEGVLTILMGSEEHDLYPGDSVHMESSTPHNWYNRTDNPVKFLMVSSPARFLREGGY